MQSTLLKKSFAPEDFIILERSAALFRERWTIIRQNPKTQEKEIQQTRKHCQDDNDGAENAQRYHVIDGSNL